jgi:hypothetical protein
MRWRIEKFEGDMAIYAFCPKCNFHDSIGDTISNEVFLYRYCPMCGEYLYIKDKKLEIDAYNERNVSELYKEVGRWKEI